MFVFLLCPETGGKTLEQVDYLFIQKGFAGLRKSFDVTPEDVLEYSGGGEKISYEKREAVERESAGL